MVDIVRKLADFAASRGLSSNSLFEMVRDAKEIEAVYVNGSGLEAQLECLVKSYGANFVHFLLEQKIQNLNCFGI